MNNNHNKNYLTVAKRTSNLSCISSHEERFFSMVHQLSKEWLGEIPQLVSHQNEYLPTFESLIYRSSQQLSGLKSSADDRLLVGKFLLDVRVDDRICAKVKFEVPYDRMRRSYQTNDYVSVIVKSVDSRTGTLDLTLNEEEAIIRLENLPSYYREFEPTSYESDPRVAELKNNPNIGALLGVRINSLPSFLPCFSQKVIYDATTSAETLRRDQTLKLAMTHVVRGAELTRNGKFFEAIQCFNKALAVDETCADAYVGRGAACAGNRNFSASLQDFDHALELQPAHKNALRYKIDVLLAHARDLEKEKNFDDASKNYRSVLILYKNHPLAVEGLSRIESNAKSPDVIQLDDEEQQSGNTAKRKNSSENIEINRKKLREIEEFIQNLKRS